jgi:hypothetical protein
MSDREIDTSDIPPMLDGSKAVVGKFYRPIKKPLTIRLDADVPAWLKAFHGMVGAPGAALRPGCFRRRAEPLGDRHVGRGVNGGDPLDPG